MVFNRKKRVQEIKDLLAEFQHIVDKVAGKQQLQFTAEIFTNNIKLPPFLNKEKVQTVENEEFLFLDMKICWSPKGGLQFGVFGNKGRKLN